MFGAIGDSAPDRRGRALMPHDYLEIAEPLRQHGAALAADLEQLWRRRIFIVLISNADDHLRHHGFFMPARQAGGSRPPMT